MKKIFSYIALLWNNFIKLFKKKKMDYIKKGLEDISGKISGLSFDAASIITQEQGINNPPSQPRQKATQERTKLKDDIDKVIDQLKALKNSF